MKDAIREAKRNLEKEIELESGRSARYLEELHNLGDHTIDEGSSTRSTVQLLGTSQRLKHYSDGLAEQIVKLSDHYFTEFPRYSTRITAEDNHQEDLDSQPLKNKICIINSDEWAELDQYITGQNVHDDTLYPMDILVNLFLRNSWNEQDVDNACQLIYSVLCADDHEGCNERLFYRWNHLFERLSESGVHRVPEHIDRLSTTISNVITKVTGTNEDISLYEFFKLSRQYLCNSNYAPIIEDILINGFSSFVQGIWRDLTPSDVDDDGFESKDGLKNFLASFNKNKYDQKIITPQVINNNDDGPAAIVINDFVFQSTPLLIIDGEDDITTEVDGAGKWAEPLNIFLTQGEGLLDKMSGITSTFKF